jgi:putative flippase GtrA
MYIPQMIRFGFVGLVSNLILYFVYLIITAVGVEYKISMTVLFCLGALQTFFFNKRWTFNHDGLLRSSLIKYLTVYSFAYLFDLGCLMVFVDVLGYPHQIIQGILIIVVALMLYYLQSRWVFFDVCTKKDGSNL